MKLVVWALAPLAVILGAAGAEATPAAAATPTEELRALHAQDNAIETVGFRLATGNAGLCLTGERNPGFSIHTIEQYAPRYRTAAAQMFSLGARVGVLSVAPGSPAAAAGLREDDALVAIDGVPLPEAGALPSIAAFDRTGAAQRLIDHAFGGHAATLTIVRAGVPAQLLVDPAPACPSTFQVVPDSRMNAAADGDYVQVSSEMVALAATEGELAGLLAHELAHNVLGHRLRLDALHVDRGVFTTFGRNARLIRETEREADLLSVDLVARAGYSPTEAIAFWTRLELATASLGGDPTHPSWSERLRSMRQEADRLAAVGGPDAPLPQSLVVLLPHH